MEEYLVLISMYVNGEEDCVPVYSVFTHMIRSLIAHWVTKILRILMLLARHKNISLSIGGL